LSIVPPKAILRLKSLATTECSNVGLQAPIHVFSMQTLCPTRPELLFDGATGKVQPWLVDISALRIRAGHPNHDRSCVSDQAKALFTLFGLCKSNGLLNFSFTSLHPLPHQRADQHRLY